MMPTALSLSRLKFKKCFEMANADNRLRYKNTNLKFQNSMAFIPCAR